MSMNLDTQAKVQQFATDQRKRRFEDAKRSLYANLDAARKRAEQRKQDELDMQRMDGEMLR